jgi:hypothetical protein
LARSLCQGESEHPILLLRSVCLPLELEAVVSAEDGVGVHLRGLGCDCLKLDLATTECPIKLSNPGSGR